MREELEKCLFVEVQDSSHFIHTKSVFEQTTLIHPNDTCLVPIKQLFSNLIKQCKVEKVAHLLALLADNQQLKKVYALGMISDTFTLPEYGTDEILARILLLQQK